MFNKTRTYDTTAFAELLKTQQLKREVRKRKRAGGGTAGQPSQPDRQPDKSPGLQPLDAGSDANASITDVVDDGCDAHSTGRPYASSDTPVESERLQSAACDRSPRPPSKETRRDSHPRTRPSSSVPDEQDRHSSDDDTSAPTPDITASVDGRSHNTGHNWDDILGWDSPPPDDRSGIRHRGGGSDIGARSQRGLQNRKEKDKVGGTLGHKRVQTTKNDLTRNQSHNTLAPTEVGSAAGSKGGGPSRLACGLCQRVLPDVLECQDCATSVRLCENCRGLHPSHTFKPVRKMRRVGPKMSTLCRKDTRNEHGQKNSHNENNREVPSEDDQGTTDWSVAGITDNGREADGSICAENHDGSGLSIPVSTPTTRQKTNPPTQLAVTFSAQGLLEFADLAQAMADAARKILDAQQGPPATKRAPRGKAPGGPSRGSQTGFDMDDIDVDEGESSRADRRVDSSDSLLEFDLEDTAFDDITLSPRGHQSAQVKGGRKRRWLDSDKRKLQQLKEKGYSDQAIAMKLKRTPGAVFQQWRKQ